MQSFDFFLIGIISLFIFGIIGVMSCPIIFGCTSFPEPYNIFRDVGIYGVGISILLIIISFVIPRTNGEPIDDYSHTPLGKKSDS